MKLHETVELELNLSENIGTKYKMWGTDMPQLGFHSRVKENITKNWNFNKVLRNTRRMVAVDKDKICKFRY